MYFVRASVYLCMFCYTLLPVAIAAVPRVSVVFLLLGWSGLAVPAVYGAGGMRQEF